MALIRLLVLFGLAQDGAAFGSGTCTGSTATTITFEWPAVAGMDMYVKESWWCGGVGGSWVVGEEQDVVGSAVCLRVRACLRTCVCVGVCA
jgi:hypothetical protein